MDLDRDPRLADERQDGAAGDGYVRPAGEGEDPQRVARRVLDAGVARHGRDPEDLEPGRREREQDRECVVVPRVAVEQDGPSDAGGRSAGQRVQGRLVDPHRTPFMPCPRTPLCRQAVASRSYGLPSAAGGVLRPISPARTTIVTT